MLAFAPPAAMQAFFERVERAGADVAEDDAERTQYQGRQARPWPGLSASGVRVLNRCDSVTSVVVGATTERSFPGQNLEPSRCGGCSRQSLMGRVDSSNPSNARNKDTRAGLSVAIRVHSISSV